MEIRTYVKIIASYWWLVVLATVAAGLGAYLLDQSRTPTYSAAARVVAQPSMVITDTRTVTDLIGQMGARYVMGTFAEAFTSDTVKAQARRTMGLRDSDAVGYPIVANVLPDTNVIEVSGTGRDPQLLASYLNTTVSTAISNTQQLFQVIDLASLQRATPPTAPSAPVPSRDIPASLGLGFVLGILLALAIDYLRGPQRTPATAPATRQRSSETGPIATTTSAD